MQVYARLIRRIASCGLALVFVALIACALWGTERMQLATDHAATAIALSDLYASANNGLDAQASLVLRHMDDLNVAPWADELAASNRTHATLLAITRTAGADDRQLAERTIKLHQAYFETVRKIYGALDSGAPFYAWTVEHTVAQPQFAATQLAIAARAAHQHEVALEALGVLRGTQKMNVRMIVAAAVLGVLQLGGCALILAGSWRKVEQARRAELASFEQAALTDSLTGLGNHRAFQEELAAQLARVERHGGVLSLAVLDIDEFKRVNDQGGHLCGDRVLVAMGGLLGGVRKGDRTFRIGGDEFAIILPDAETVEAASIMDRIRQAAPGQLFGATVCIGIATTDGSGTATTDGSGSATTANPRGFDPVHLRAQADCALYAGKQSGRNTVITYADRERGVEGTVTP